MKNKNVLNININIKIIIIFLIIIIIFLIILFFLLNKKIKETFLLNENKYVCLYAYYEKNEEYKEHLKYFLKNAINKNIDYYIIINGDCSIEIPINTNTNINIIKRINKGFDFGAWSYCIKTQLQKKYDYYIFLNSSVIGPIPEYYSKEINKCPEWLNRFLELFNDTPDIKLVGTSINILMNTWKEYPFLYEPPYTHVQSMFFILNNEGFNFLLNNGFFNDEEILNNITDMKYMVTNKEIKMSQLILKNNWNINAILPKYRGKDYRLIKKNFNPSSESPYNGSLDFPNKKNYFGENIKPEEVIFYKTNISNIV